jgi:hypothetical protein
MRERQLEDIPLVCTMENCPGIGVNIQNAKRRSIRSDNDIRACSLDSQKSATEKKKRKKETEWK